MNLPHLKRIRWTVRATLTLGVAASVAANVLHAEDNPISQLIAAWPPLALLLTVELISRIPVHRRSLAAVRLAATATIAGIAAWVSYWHMVGVASRYGETGLSPYLLPLSVDGLVLVASVSLVELAGRIRELEAPHRPAPDRALGTAGSAPIGDLSPTPGGDALGGAKPQITGPADTDLTPVGEGSPAGHDDLDGPARPNVEQTPRAASRTPPTAPRKKPAATGKRATDSATLVARAHARNPAATNAEIAEKAGLGIRTVARHRPAIRQATTTPDMTPVNGAQPALNGGSRS